jgi:hypothetical protein
VECVGLMYIGNEKTKRLAFRALCYRATALTKTVQKLGFAVVSETWAYRSVAFVDSWAGLAQSGPVPKVARAPFPKGVGILSCYQRAQPISESHPTSSPGLSCNLRLQECECNHSLPCKTEVKSVLRNVFIVWC